MQYSSYDVSVENGSNIVTGNASCKFLTNVAAGYGFKLKRDAVVYTVASVTDDTHFTLSVPYEGATASTQLYQITTDYTPLLGLAEINAGDQDWDIHLTQETLRKIDTILGGLIGEAGISSRGPWNATTNSPPIPAAAIENLGWEYIVSVEGTYGEITFAVGDLYISNGTAWVRIPAPTSIPSGGTVGQVLTKSSSTNFDASWETPSGLGPTYIAVTGETIQFRVIGTGSNATVQIEIV